MPQLTQFTIERVADAIFWIDPDGQFIYANEAACELLGYSQDTLVHLSVFDINPNFPKAMWHGHWQELKSAGALNFESSLLDAKGRSFPVEISANHIEFQGQQYNCAFVRDISDRRTAERELGLMKTAVEKSSTAFYRLSPQGEVLYVNEHACQSLGYNREELIGRHVWEFDPDFPPEAWAPMWEGLKRNGVVFIESRHRRKDGSIFPIEVTGNYIHAGGEEYTFCFVQDISERKRIEEQLKLAHTTINKSRTAFYWLSTQGQVQYANEFACESLGYPLEEMIGMHVWEFDPDFPPEAWPASWEDLKKQGTLSMVSRHQRKDGSIFPIEITANYIVSANAEHSFVFVQDITERKQAEENIRRLAHYDALTGLPNRTLLQDRMHQMIAWANRDQKKFSVLFLDLDRFKYVNDSMGHAVGDKLLQNVAQRLQDCIREGDTISRIGGDEFIILLRDADAKGAAVASSKILETLEVTYAIDDLEVFTHASIGISIYPDNAEDVDQLIKYADTAMYRAKEEGRNNFQFFGNEMNLRSTLLFSLEKDLRLALERNEFSLHYQPQADLATGEVCGAEALLRWKHPQKGFVSPAEFIPVAEDTGQIIPIGEWVLRTACSQLASMRAQGLPVFPISVNLSIRQMRQPGLSAVITRIIRENGLQPGDLELEITEGVMMTHVQSAVAFLEEMRQLGVQLAIDDFGTGFSSLSYLKKLPVTKLKIDQSFVRDIEEDESDDAIVRSIIGLGHQFKLKVIAEGMETREQLEFLHANGCDQIQGYYFSRPLPADEFTAFIAGKHHLR
ncbi:MAG TPA: EAL domain-containing protein [Methylophilaceae bacterium]|nr:EAL domain-containing protein [Methylophilaceae bacterium]